MSVLNFRDLRAHVGHKIEVVNYGEENVAIECIRCNEVLLDFDKDTDTEKEPTERKKINIVIVHEENKDLTIYTDGSPEIDYTITDLEMKTGASYFCEGRGGASKKNHRESLSKFANKFYPPGTEFVCNRTSDELEGVKGVIKEVRFAEEKETDNSGIFEIECELFPTEEQEREVNEEYGDLEYGFGFDFVILNEDMIDILKAGEK